MNGDVPHEFDEDVDDGSMCMCGVPATEHWRVEPPEQTRAVMAPRTGWV